jgi:hypothetical protein
MMMPSIRCYLPEAKSCGSGINCYAQLSAICTNFRRKNWCLSQKTMFFSKLAVCSLRKTTQRIFFAKYFGENFSKIVTTVPDQGCQMVCFQTKNPNFGKF